MNARFYIFALLFTIICLSACVPTQHLAEDERLLVQVKPKGLNQIDPLAIEALYQQRPNRLVFGSAPYLSLYYFGKRFYSPQRIDARIAKTEEKKQQKIAEAGTDSVEVRKIQTRFDARIGRLQKRKEEGNFFMRMGEPPAIFDSTLMVRTMDQIDVYLNAKGFFKHDSNYEAKEKAKKVYIDINIKENEPYRYSELDYGIPDSAVLQLVQSVRSVSLIKPGDIYDEDKLSAERDRLYTLMRNSGYYDFARAYILFEPDTSFGGNTVRLRTVIQNPEDENYHRVYSINNIYFKTDPDRFGVARDTVTHNNIKYLAYNHRYSYRLLDSKVDIEPGQRFSQLQTSITQRRLSDLDVFQFNNLLYTKVTDPSDTTGYKLNAFINATPSKKFQETAELGVSYTERLPGPFSNLRLRVRNIFGGAENLDFGVRFGLEGQLSIAGDEAILIREFGGDVALSFPKFLMPFVPGTAFQNNNPRTRIVTGITNVNRSEYQRSLYEFSLNYILQRSQSPLQEPTLQYGFSPINLTVIQANRIDSTFRNALVEISQGSQSLINSFESGVISFMAFNLVYNTNNITQTKNARYFRTLLELGGLTKELGIDPSFGNLRTFQYAKLNPDYRRYIPLGGKRFFAYRVNTGVGTTMFKSDVLPYDKYFFAGGANSVRAWRVRRLGPGSYATTREVKNENGQVIGIDRDYLIEQPGEVLLEGSAEYRFNMFSFVNGAFFVDAGNVWFTKKDAERPGADFQFGRFYKEIAVGTGFGLRFDLSALILRFDLATKVYDPAVLDGNRFLLNNFRFSDIFRQSNQTNINIGIGYPF